MTTKREKQILKQRKQHMFWNSELMGTYRKSDKRTDHDVRSSTKAITRYVDKKLAEVKKNIRKV